MEIAKRSRGTPCIALRLLCRVKDFADVVDVMDIKLLNLLVSANGRAMGLSTIAAALSEDEGTVEDVLEPYLLANGYLERTAKGRRATRATYEILDIIPPAEEGRLF